MRGADLTRFSGAGAMAALALVAAGCATVEKGKKPEPTQTATAAPAGQETRGEEAEKKKGAARKAAPRARSIPVRPLNVSADCAFRDPNGYRGAMKLRVAEAKVQRFEASVNIPPHGSCRFALNDFRQTDEMPNPVLKHQHNSCEVRMWEQGSRVTVAFSHCRDMCSSRAAFERLWPILADSGNGTCG